MKKYLLAVLFILLIGITSAYATYVYTAREISYTPEDQTWNVDNVQDAINELKTTCETPSQCAPRGITFTVIALGNNEHEQYGQFLLENDHGYKKLKINSYYQIENSYASFPQIVIDSTTYNRPEVGTEFDIEGKKVIIGTLSVKKNWQKTGVNITLE